MVAAKLDQTRVLVTKFRENRLTLKGRSAGQRHTHRQTHRQTRLTIMALQVCNGAKNRLLEVDGGHVPQCHIAGDANVL